MKQQDKPIALPSSDPQLITPYTFADDLTPAEMVSLANQAEEKITKLASGLQGVAAVMTALLSSEDDLTCRQDDMSRVWELVAELGSQVEQYNTARSNLCHHLNNREIDR
ncbi:MAG: hypothetical protein ACRCWL_04150 [Aeromonas sp.]